MPDRVDPLHDAEFAWSCQRSEEMRRLRAERERGALLDAARAVIDTLPGGADAQRYGGGPIATLARIVWRLDAGLPPDETTGT